MERIHVQMTAVMSDRLNRVPMVHGVQLLHVQVTIHVKTVRRVDPVSMERVHVQRTAVVLER